MKIQKILLGLLIVWCASFARAELVLDKTALEDQFGVVTSIDSETKWLIFASDMDGYKIVRDAFLNDNVESLKDRKIHFAADISKMPAMISKMFAIPKMKDFKFQILLDQEGDVTKSWPRKEKEVAILKLENGKAVSTKFVKEVSEVSQFLKENP